jgi:hypothetical protein
VAVLLGVLFSAQRTRAPWLVNTGFVILSLALLAITVGQVMEAKNIRSLRSTRTTKVVLGACWELFLILIGLSLFCFVAARGLRLISDW